MQALSVTEGAVWGGGLHAADTRAKMFVSLLASVATVALSGVATPSPTQMLISKAI